MRLIAIAVVAAALFAGVANGAVYQHSLGLAQSQSQGAAVYQHSPGLAQSEAAEIDRFAPSKYVGLEQAAAGSSFNWGLAGAVAGGALGLVVLLASGAFLVTRKGASRKLAL